MFVPRTTGWAGVVVGIAAAVAGCVQPGDAPGLSPPIDWQRGECRMSADDARWLGDALRQWQRFSRDSLKLADRSLPPIVTFDARCAYGAGAGRDAFRGWSSSRHDGQVALPNGGRIPASPNAFNGQSDEGNFVVMSLPSIWRTAGFATPIGLDLFLEGVMFHELTHSYHADFLGPSSSFPAIAERYGFAAGLSDDSVQEHFRADPAYVRDHETETATLYRAAAAATDAEARELACSGLAGLRERRRRHFAGPEEKWRIVDELSLTTEGLGQWTSFSWLTRGRGLAAADVLPRLRGSFWSQDEGLAIFLVIDRLVEDWQRRVFASPSETAELLLARACGR